MCTKKELPACPVETTLTMISDKWKVLILRDLLTGTKRFGELKKSLTGVSQKVLTSGRWRKTVWWSARPTRRCRPGWSTA